MVLLFSAMISEVFKAAYQAIPKGQLEAGLSIGLTSEQTFVRIIAPQAFKVALPNITTAILNLMRDAALAYTIGFIDVMGKLFFGDLYSCCLCLLGNSINSIVDF